MYATHALITGQALFGQKMTEEWSSARAKPKTALRPSCACLRPVGDRRVYFGLVLTEKLIFGLKEADGVIVLQITH